MPKDPKEDNIPTLDDLLSQGETAAAPQDRNEAPAPGKSAQPILEESDAAHKSAFEATVEAIITEVINRHMARAREEITQTILAEVRSRLPGQKHRPPPADQ